MEFERPLLELRAQIEKLTALMNEQQIDLTSELSSLEARARALEEEIYGGLTPGQRMQIASHPKRPTSLDYMEGVFTDFTELSGDRLFREDAAMVGGIARLDDIPVTVVGTQRGKDTKENVRRNFGMARPEGYRKAQRLFSQADKFGRPVIAFVDTKGAAPDPQSEERGISDAIARSISVMLNLNVPTIAILSGEGGSGGALALGAADRILMLEHAWFSAIAPRSAAVILWKDPSQSHRAVEYMRITANELQKLGVVDRIIREPLGGAHKDPNQMVDILREVIREELEALLRLSPAERERVRYEKYRAIGALGQRE